jgi:glutamate formiminotransferase
MRLLAVPNWSFGRERAMLRQFREILSHPAVELHYCEADVDHNRTITAFSGEEDVVADMVFRLAISSFDSIDLNKHAGVHPRIGALDVCPLVVLSQDSRSPDGLLLRALAVAENLAGRLAATFDLPIFLYERSERGRHEADLPSLRKGGFDALLNKALKPDFGPSGSHPRLGVTVLGVRDPLIAFNVNLETEDVEIAKTLARQIRQMRSEGDARVLGARVMGLPLPSRNMSQLNFSLTLPDLTPVDPIVTWIHEQVANVKVKVAESELTGVIRNSDVPNASRLLIRPKQIVEG